MSVGKKELLCSNCRKRVSYHIFKRPAKTIIKDIEIKYEEYYGICDECKSEIFIPGLDDRNEDVIEEEFRKKKELITISDIKKILEKYNIEKRPLSKLLGFGELTITRYLDGQLPSVKYVVVIPKVYWYNKGTKRECKNEEKNNNLPPENRFTLSQCGQYLSGTMERNSAGTPDTDCFFPT